MNQGTICVYGVEQSSHGHNYRWIFDKQTLLENGIDLTGVEEGLWDDIGFPIGGSNSSATYIVELHSKEEAEKFLMADYYTDYDDPQLVEIAEGICTIDSGDSSITQQFTDISLPITKNNRYLGQAYNMIRDLQEKNIDCGIDYNSPFYGSSKDMRLSELEDLWEEYTKPEEKER